MTIKRVTITAYDITTTKATTKALKPTDDIIKELTESETIDKRFMILSGLDEHKEGDFIASFKNQKKYLFGLLIRMKEGEMAHILKAQLKNPLLSLEDIEKETEDGVAGTVKSYSYFLLNKNQLIYTSGGLSLKSFETYINWLLRKEDNEKTGYIFNPIIKEQAEVTIPDIKSIDIADTFFESNDEFKNITKNLNILKLGILEKLLSDSRDLKEIEAENIISAHIQLKIKTKSGKKDASKKKALTSLIKSVDNDDIIITSKDGKKIKGTSFVVKKTLLLETTKSGFPVESQIESEMSSFAEGVQNGEEIN